MDISNLPGVIVEALMHLTNSLGFHKDWAMIPVGFVGLILFIILLKFFIKFIRTLTSNPLLALTFFISIGLVVLGLWLEDIKFVIGGGGLGGLTVIISFAMGGNNSSGSHQSSSHFDDDDDFGGFSSGGSDHDSGGSSSGSMD